MQTTIPVIVDEEEDPAVVGQEMAAGAMDVDDPTQKTLYIPDHCPDLVYVAFFEHSDYENASLWDTLLSSQLRYVSKKYEHCQLMFEWMPAPWYDDKGKHPGSHDENGRVIATFSTTKRSPSSFTSVCYKHERWVIIDVKYVCGQNHMHASKRQRLLEWAIANEKKPFNTFGHYFNFILPISCCPSLISYDAGGSSFFCAEQVASGLAHVDAGSFVNTKPYLCTPDLVYDLLIKDGGTMTCINAPIRVAYSPPGSKAERSLVCASFKDIVADTQEQRRMGTMTDEEEEEKRTWRSSCIYYSCATCRTFQCGAGTMAYGGVYAECTTPTPSSTDYNHPVDLRAPTSPQMFVPYDRISPKSTRQVVGAVTDMPFYGTVPQQHT